MHHVSVREQASKDLQVHATIFSMRPIRTGRQLLDSEPIARDAAKKSMTGAVNHIHDNDQVLDSMNATWLASSFYQQFQTNSVSGTASMCKDRPAQRQSKLLQGTRGTRQCHMPMRLLINLLRLMFFSLRMGFFVTSCAGHGGLFIMCAGEAEQEQSSLGLKMYHNNLWTSCVRVQLMGTGTNLRELTRNGIVLPVRTRGGR